MDELFELNVEFVAVGTVKLSGFPVVTVPAELLKCGVGLEELEGAAEVTGGVVVGELGIEAEDGFRCGEDVDGSNACLL